MVDDVTNQTEKDVCPTPGCGARLPVAPLGSINVLHASFPDELASVGSLLTGSMDRIYCQQCHQSSAYQSAALCKVYPVRTAFVYIPTKIAEEHPEMMLKLRSNLEEAKSILADFQVEIITDSKHYQKRLAAVISSLVVPLLNGFSLACTKGKAELEQWLLQNEDKLDRAFFAGTVLLIQKAIPFSVFIAKDAKNDEISKEELLKTIHDRVREILVLRAARLAQQLVDHQLLGSVEETIAKVVHQDVVDEVAIKHLAEVFSSYEKRDDTSSLENYAHQAVMAAICQFAKQENPKQDTWAAWYVAFELERRTSKDKNTFDGFAVPLTFARRTIPPEQFWNQLGPRFHQAIQHSDKEALETLFELANDLELQDLLMSWLADGLVPILDELPEDKLQIVVEEQFFPLALNHPEGCLPMVKSWLHGLANRDPFLVVTFGKKLRLSMLSSGYTDQSIVITCYMSEILNDFLLYRLAKQIVDIWIEELKQIQAWPPKSTSTYVDIMTEEGNCLRNIGDPSTALECYELCKQLLPDDLNNKTVRVNERNRAIVLREVGRVRESISILSGLLPHTRATEKAMVLSSIATCLGVLGQLGQAKRTFQQALTDLPQGKMVDSARLSLLINIASLAQREHDFELAGEAGSEALDIAIRQHNLWMQLIAIGLLASSATKELMDDEGQYNDVIDKATQILSVVSDAPEKFLPPPTYDIGLRFLLAEQLENKGEISEAEYILEQAIARYSQSSSDDQLWVLWAKLAEYAQKQGNSELAWFRLLQARQAVMCITAQVEPEGDPFGLMTNKEGLQQVMGEVFLKAYRESKIAATDIRLMADFQASIVLSHRLWAPWRPEEYRDNSLDPAYDYGEEQLGQLAAQLTSSDEKIGVLQVFEASSGLYLFLTEISHDHTASYLLPLILDGNVIDQLVRRTSFRLEQCKPQQRSNPLEQVAGWKEFAVTLRAAISSFISPGTQLCVVPGLMSGLPLQMALGQDYPLSYAPSLSIALLLHKRRLQMKEGSRWRPGSVNDFVVWRVGERPEIIKHFQYASTTVEAYLSAIGVQYTCAVGIAGTKEALFQGLQTSECVRLSCHGRVRADNLRFELLVAADGQLPPADTTALDSERGQQFLVNWQTITELRNCAPIVFSAACASGMAISLSGGERIGLERSLFRAGTLTYVAPQWPVPVAQIQPLINRIMTKYIVNPHQTMADVVFEEVNAAVAEGVPDWVARSVAVLGDWL